MGKAVRKIVTFIVAACLMAGLSGCYDRRELDTLGIVLGVGLDKSETEGETDVTVQMANPGGASSSKSSKGSKAGEKGTGTEEAYINQTGSGKLINDIIRDMQHEMSRRIYVAHSQVMVIGEDLAKSGLRDSLDFFLRAPEARMTLYVFVAKGRAQEILSTKPEFEKITSTELSKMLKDQKITSEAPIITEFDFVESICSKTTAAYAPLVRLDENNGKKRLTVEGCAVFDQSRMVGELNAVETRGLLFATGKTQTGVIPVSVEGVSSTIEIKEASSNVTPTLYTDGTAAFNIDIKTLIGIGDQTGTLTLSDEKTFAPVLAATAEAIKGEILSAVEKSKELDADIFGFGEMLYRKYPKQWEKLKDNWKNAYKNITVTVSVNAKADGSGRIGKPLAPEGN
ncbi:Ger(x)C family spore germination protein [Oscillospiraceae bacterium CM]|nr:Ger(x)C family spore germination protein [Oscillospiraceae bacterium CM]